MGGRKWPWVVFAAFVLVAAGLTVAFSLAGDGGGPKDGSDPQSSESTVKEDLLEQVRPRPSCPTSEGQRPPGEGEEMVVHTTVENDCLVFTTEIVPADEAEARVAELRARDDVVSADVEELAKPGGQTTGSGVAKNPPWQYPLLQGPQIEQRWPPDAPEVTVAVIDSGIDETHPALAGTVITKAPWNQPARHEEDQHGTQIAGMIVARQDTLCIDVFGDERACHRGVAGLTPRVRLLDAQYYVYNAKEETWEWPGKLPEEARSIGELVTWSVNQDADVISLSMSGPKPSENDEAALRVAETHGVVTVAMAGNCGDGSLDKNGCISQNELQYPASYEDLVLSVASIDRSEERASTSSVNSSVDVTAPGQGVPTTCLSGKKLRPTTCEAKGTSFSTPMVAAAAAFLTAVVPDASPREIRAALIETALCHDKCRAHRDAYGSGIVQPIQAAAHASAAANQESFTNDVVAAYTAQDPLTTAGAQGSPPTEAFLQLRDGSRVKFRKIAAREVLRPGGPAGPTFTNIELAFSPDGEIAAATDGRRLTVVRMIEGYPQRTVRCRCSGLAFRPADQVLVTWRGLSDLTLFDVSSGDPRLQHTVSPMQHTVSPKRGAAVSKLEHGIVLGSDDDHAYAFVQDPRSLDVAGDVVAVAYDGGLATPIARAPYGVSEVAISEDASYLAYPANDDCLSGAEVRLVDLGRINYSTPKPHVPLRDLGNPGGTGINLVSLRFEGDELIAGWAEPEPGATGCQDYQAPDLYRAEVGVPSRTGWRLVETGVAWQASIAGYGELALKGGVGSSWTHEQFLLSVTTADLPHRRPRDTRTLAREVDQVLLRPVSGFDPPPTKISADEFAGLWEGQVSQPGGRQPTYTIKLRLTVGNGNEIAGTFDFPELNCGGRIEFISLLGRELTFTDIITYGKSNCVSGGSVRFLLDSGSLDRAHRTWKAMWHGELLTSTATLRKAP